MHGWSSPSAEGVPVRSLDDDIRQIGGTWSVLRGERVDHDTVLLALGGELDLAAHGPVTAVLRELERGGCRLVVIDLRAVTFLDCWGIRVVLDAFDRCRAAARGLLVVAPPPPADRLFELVDLPGTLQVAPALPVGLP